MIVRIMGEGQMRVDDSHLPAEIESGDHDGFRRTLGALLDAVRSAGEPLPADALEPSGLILPAPDATLEEVKAILKDDGLIPG
jgi:hypothetical protein